MWCRCEKCGLECQQHETGKLETGQRVCRGCLFEARGAYARVQPATPTPKAKPAPRVAPRRAARTPTHTVARTLSKDAENRALRALVCDPTPACPAPACPAPACPTPPAKLLKPAPPAQPVQIVHPTPVTSPAQVGGNFTVQSPVARAIDSSQGYMLVPVGTPAAGNMQADGPPAIPPSILLKLPLNDIDSRYLLASEKNLFDALVRSLMSRS